MSDMDINMLVNVVGSLKATGYNVADEHQRVDAVDGGWLVTVMVKPVVEGEAPVTDSAFVDPVVDGETEPQTDAQTDVV